MTREINRIEELVKVNPRGMTISGIARKLGLNRNTVARYLDIMLTDGRLEMRQVGSAKLYSLSHRVPIAALIDASSDMIAVLNKDLIVVQGNVGFSNLISTKKNELVGANLKDSPLSSAEIELNVAEALKGVHSISETTIDTEQGLQYISVTFLPINLGDGTPGVCLIATDISEKKRMTKDLYESEEKYRTLVNAMGDDIFVLDKGDIVTEVYQSKYASIPIQIDEDAGQHFSKVVPSAVVELFDQAIQDVRTTAESRSVDFSMELESTAFWLSAVLTLHEDNERVIILVRDITKRREAELQLMESEETFRSVFVNAGIGMSIVDSEHRLIDVNPAFQELVGYTKDEMLGLSWKDLTHPDDIESELSFSDEMLRLGQNKFSYKKRYIRKDEVVVWANLTVTIVRDSEGDPMFTIGMIDDITNQYHLESSLQESKDRFRATFYKSPIGINLFDSEGLLMHANRALLDMYGVQHEDKLIGINIFEDPNLSEEAKERMRAGDTFSFQTVTDFDEITRTGFYKTSKSGKAVLDVVIGPLGIDEDGNPTGFIIQIIDITAQVNAEMELTEMNEFYQTVLDNIVNGVVVHDRMDRISYINKAGVEIVGLPREEIMGTNILTGFPKESLENARHLYLSAKRGRKPQRFEAIEIISPIGERYYQSGWLIPLIKQAQYEGMIVTIEDITSFVEATNRLQIESESTDQLQKTQQLEQQVENEKLLRHLTERFIGSSNWDTAIHQSLSDIGSHLGLERIGIFLIDANEKLGSFQYEWCRKGTSGIASRLQDIPIFDYIWIMGKKDSKEPIVISDPSLIPSEGSVERNILQTLDINSLVAVPLYVGLEFKGLIGATGSEAREYSQEEITLLKSVTDIIARMMESKRV